MEKDKVFSTWINPVLIKRIKIYCVKNNMTVKEFIRDSADLMFNTEMVVKKYGKQSSKLK